MWQSTLERESFLSLWYFLNPKPVSAGSPWLDGGGEAEVGGILHNGITKMQWSMIDMGYSFGKNG
jgi:hypothetical protein